ncbi:MAG TPA: alpha/beta fold hydrolase [Baekduia sp.]|nr:alpha/beta fold hydrolase [Baekduia sp.]
MSDAAAKPSGRLAIATTCFTAQSPDGRSSTIYGERFTVGTPNASTAAIVLVHGVGSNTRTWDAVPSWSVARRLAAAGYVVIAYDRLGYDRSPYTGPGGGNALTVDAQQRVLHDLIGQVHAGTYRVGPAPGTCSKRATLHTTGYASRRVAIIGHSAGGFIVSSYPGRYHDVVAMVQANAPSGLFSKSPAGNAALVSATAPPARGSMADEYGPIGDGWDDGKPPPVPGLGYALGFPVRRGCEDFNFWRPGAVKDVATYTCDPANSLATPSGETASFVDQALNRNPAYIARTGDIPVLLAGADHDAIMPANANALELSAWQETCRCHVSQFILEDTGHSFMGHKSLTRWIGNVVGFLRKNDIPGGSDHEPAANMKAPGASLEAS